MDPKNVRFGAVTNDHFIDEGKYYVTIWMVSDWAGGDARIMEPDKCTDMAWRTFDSLPNPLFLSWDQLLPSEFMEKIKQEMRGSKCVCYT